MSGDTYRRTGRTTQQLTAACEAAQNGKRVLFVVPTTHMIGYCMNLVGERGGFGQRPTYGRGGAITFAGGGAVRIVTPLSVYRERGRSPLYYVLDHSVLDILRPRQLNELFDSLNTIQAERLTSPETLITADEARAITAATIAKRAN